LLQYNFISAEVQTIQNYNFDDFIKACTFQNKII
jgi:hypothetical protein